MAYFNEFPHTRTYDSDLGWLIRHVGENIESLDDLKKWAASHKTDYNELKDKVDGLIENLIDVIVPWDSSIAYHIFSIVEYQGTNYIAVQDVPIGTMITNTEYWVPANTVVEQINAIGTVVSELENGVNMPRIYDDINDIDVIEGRYIFLKENDGIHVWKIVPTSEIDGYKQNRILPQNPEYSIVQEVNSANYPLYGGGYTAVNDLKTITGGMKAYVTSTNNGHATSEGLATYYNRDVVIRETEADNAEFTEQDIAYYPSGVDAAVVSVTATSVTINKDVSNYAKIGMPIQLYEGNITNDLNSNTQYVGIITAINENVLTVDKWVQMVTGTVSTPLNAKNAVINPVTRIYAAHSDVVQNVNSPAWHREMYGESLDLFNRSTDVSGLFGYSVYLRESLTDDIYGYIVRGLAGRGHAFTANGSFTDYLNINGVPIIDGYNERQTKSFNKVFAKIVTNNTETFTYNMLQSDFYTLRDDGKVQGRAEAGLYIVFSLSWARTPVINIDLVAYSGGGISNLSVTHLVGPDQRVSASDGVITITGGGAVTIYSI